MVTVRVPVRTIMRTPQSETCMVQTLGSPARRTPSPSAPCDHAPPVHFITLRTACGRPLLGSVIDATMRLAEAGEIARQEWLYAGILRVGVTVDAFVVMPDHLHGILVIDGDNAGAPPGAGAIVSAFKAASSVRINGLGDAAVGRVWQRGHCERIIRCGDELAAVRAYVHDSPRRWWMRNAGVG